MLQSTSRKELFRLAEGDEDLMAMAKKIDDLNTDYNIIGLYDEEKMKQAMYNFDINEAKEQGGNEKAIAIAKKLLEDGMDISKVASITGLNEDDITNL